MELSKFKHIIDIIKTDIKNTEFDKHVFIVGGAVRNFLLGMEINDIDICVDLPNGGIKFAEFITKKHNSFKQGSNPVIFETYGTAKFNLYDSNISDIDIEVVQTRKEQYKDPNSRNPSTEFGTILEDALRRDLTINALYLDISERNIVDPTFSGLTDIQNKTIRTPSFPNITFHDDALRMLRVIRFATKLGWGIDKCTWFGICENAYRINTISQERITDEINKILLCDKPSIGIRRLLGCGLLKLVLPNVYEMIGVEQNKYHFGDVFEHTMCVLDSSLPILEHRLSALFHDVGKTVTKSIVDGKVHFYTHEIKGCEMVRDILKDMKYPNSIIDKVSTAVKFHMYFKNIQNPSNKTIRKFCDKVGNDNMDLCLDVIHADNISHQLEYCDYNQVPYIREQIKLDDKQTQVKLPINGNDIMSKFNLKKGKYIGYLLDLIKEHLFENPNLSKEECFEIIEKEIYNENIV